MSKKSRSLSLSLSACALLIMAPFATMALEYDFEAQPSGIPGYATVVKVVQDDEEKSVLKFANAHTIFKPGKLHSILAAYGAQYDLEARPSGIPGYASVVKVVQDDEEKLALKFANAHTIFKPGKLHSILAAYGAEYDFETKPSGIPGYASVVKVVQDDEEKLALSFSNAHTIFKPGKIHSILSAYRLR